MPRLSQSVCCLSLALAFCGTASGDLQQAAYDPDRALEISQAAIGRKLEDLEFTDTQGHAVTLSDYRGKPLLVSMIFTSCYHVCPALTRYLKDAVATAREAVGEDSFRIVTIGFDTANDSPQRMQEFARKQGVDDPDWTFLSGTEQSIEALTRNLGFVYFRTPRGFDHITQTTIVDADGVIYRQVYGGAFKLPWLVEPLKDLVFNRPQSTHNFLAGLVDKVRLFCTVYDPNTGRYRIDYSLFVQIAIGALVILGIVGYLLLEIRRSRHPRQGD